MSYETGIITCRFAMINGKSLAEQVSMLTEAEIREAAKKRDDNVKDSSVAGIFLKRVNTSCEAIGYTEAAFNANWQYMYALCDFFSFSDIFFMLTPDVQCSFRVRLWDVPGKQHTMPSLNCTDRECFADFILRRDVSLKYPGACSLECQSAVQILLKCQFGWDPKQQKGERGIFGKLLTIGVGHKEQGQKTLHGHWNMWIKNLRKTKESLFH